MQQPTEVLNIFEKYRAITDIDLKELFVNRKEDMYGMMQYFLGYADEKFQPQEIYAGKRFRSGLCLCIADMYNKVDHARSVAAAIELFHNFTLIHDDIVDKDELRRGRPTVWKLWGADHAINTGDAQMLLVNIALSKYLHEQPKEGVKVFRFLNEQFLLVTEGQYLDFEMSAQHINDSYITKERYFDMIVKKTSVLVGAATKAAGMVARCDEKEVRALWDFGYHLGIAYQLSDDIMSIWGEGEITGKDIHNDLKEKKKTLPVLYAYEVLEEKERVTLADLYRKEHPLSLDETTRIVGLLEKVCAREFVKKEIHTHAEKAKDAVRALEVKKEDKERLHTIVDALLPNV